MADREGVLANLASVIDDVLPGARRRLPIMDGFAISGPRGGQAIVWSAPGDPWFLNFTAGVAKDVSTLEAAYAWVNQKNASSYMGKYYASVPAEGAARANIVFNECVFSMLLDEAPNILAGYVQLVMQAAVEVADGESQGFLQVVGGSPFGDTDDDRGILAMAALG